jgi:hypothetical protein
VTEYFAVRDRAGQVVSLARIRRTDTATYPELLKDGTWVEAPEVMRYLFDRDPRDEVDASEAAAIAARLGGAL